MEDLKVYSASTFAILQSYLTDFNPIITFAISIITLLYLIEKYKSQKKINKNND